MNTVQPAEAPRLTEHSELIQSERGGPHGCHPCCSRVCEVKPVLVSLGHSGIPLLSHPLQTALSSFLTHAVSIEVLGCCFSCIWPPISPDPWDTSDS